MTPTTDARDAVFFLHGIFDTALGWVANGVTGSQAFAAYDAGLDVWLGTSRSNPPRTHADPAHRGGRYFFYSVNELAMYDVGAQVDAIDACKRRELFAAQLRGAVLALTPEAGAPNNGKLDHDGSRGEKQRGATAWTSPRRGWTVGSAPDGVPPTKRVRACDGAAEEASSGTSSHPLSDTRDEWHSPASSPGAHTPKHLNPAASTSSPDSWHECEPNSEWRLPPALRPTLVLPAEEAADVMVPDLYASHGRQLDPEQEAGALPLWMETHHVVVVVVCLMQRGKWVSLSLFHSANQHRRQCTPGPSAARAGRDPCGAPPAGAPLPPARRGTLPWWRDAAHVRSAAAHGGPAAPPLPHGAAHPGWHAPGVSAGANAGSCTVVAA